MIDIRADYEHDIQPQADGTWRIDFPMSAVDGYVAQTQQEADLHVKAEMDRLSRHAMADPAIGLLLAELENHAAAAAADLDIELDLPRMILFFPEGEMLGVDYALPFFRAWAEAVRSGERPPLDNDNYPPHIAQAQRVILRMGTGG
jgi:hypothetical protein